VIGFGALLTVQKPAARTCARAEPPEHSNGPESDFGTTEGASFPCGLLFTADLLHTARYPEIYPGSSEATEGGLLRLSTSPPIIMTRHAKMPSVHIEVVAATPEQEPILANLLELYAHDFSEFRDFDLGTDGRFGYGRLSLYWSDPDRHPFLVKIDGKLAGFAFVKRGSEVSASKTVWDMAEFFVTRRYRRQGLGTQITHELWRRFPGLWEVRVMQSNVPAYHFWARAISMFTGEAIHSVGIEKGGERWELFSFESKGAQ